MVVAMMQDRKALMSTLLQTMTGKGLLKKSQKPSCKGHTKSIRLTLHEQTQARNTQKVGPKRWLSH